MADPRSVRQASQLHAVVTTSGRIAHRPSAEHLLNSLTNCLSAPRHLRYVLSLFDRLPHPPLSSTTPPPRLPPGFRRRRLSRPPPPPHAPRGRPH
ncbi:unnamed protein product [Miscanthus lutarioriparius]|uniref:Uncharacterized protein n=1 Tax=Miscanthus lutarioriparius TaxID=422564 RepID=A0A811S786_9POAL|nr:unnamed protein product [Miscanthus lutarioriparius]